LGRSSACSAGSRPALSKQELQTTDPAVRAAFQDIEEALLDELERILSDAA
jgi:hypothetical protein